MTVVITMSILSKVVNSIYNPSASHQLDANVAHVVTCFTALSSYVCIMPIIAYFTFKYYGANVSLPDLLSIYGYSIVSFVPMTFLYLLPFRVFRAAVLLGASGISLCFLERNLGPLCEMHLDKNAFTARVCAVLAKVLLIYIIYFHIYA